MAIFKKGSVESASKTAMIRKLSSLIDEEEEILQSTYAEIGNLYISAHRADAEMFFSSQLAIIQACEQRIAEYRSKIINAKGLVKCESCGAEVSKDHTFCPICGKKLPKPPVPDSLHCLECHRPVEKGMKFCPHCGTEIVHKAENKCECGASLIPGNRFCTKCGREILLSGLEIEFEDHKDRACPKCGAPIIEGNRFCVGCGEPLTDGESQPVPKASAMPVNRICPKCGAKTIEGNAFCVECGTRL